MSATTASWYAIVHGAGNLISTGTAIADAATLAAQGYSAITLPGNPSGQVWNPSTKTFSPPPAPPVILSPWQFIGLFTPVEFASIRASTDPQVGQFLLMI